MLTRPPIVTNLRSRIERWRSPGIATCERCQRPFTFVEPRSVAYGVGRGCFSICTGCWDAVPVEMRLAYFYWTYSRVWKGYPDMPWGPIEKAVREGWTVHPDDGEQYLR